jgi:IS30 family transposase
MSDLHYIEIEKKLNQVLGLVELLVPESFTISYIANATGANRDTIYKYVQRNYIENIDYKMKNSKITVRREIGLELLRRYKNAG